MSRMLKVHWINSKDPKEEQGETSDDGRAQGGTDAQKDTADGLERGGGEGRDQNMVDGSDR